MREISFALPPDVVEAFTSAAITTLRELARTEAFVDSAIPRLTGPSVSATIRLLRPVPGVMTLVLSTDTAAQLASGYLPEGTPLTEDLIDDVAGEFANVIAGQAKTILKGTPYHFTITPPQVVRGLGHEHHPDGSHAVLAASLDSEIGRLRVLVELSPFTAD